MRQGRQRMRSPLPALWLFLLLGGLLGGGCMQAMIARVTLPAAHTVIRDQLVLHSDFPLAARHRLLEELSGRRKDLGERLALPVSDEPIHLYLFEDPARFDAFVRLYYPDFPPRRAYFVETDTRLRVYAYWGDQVAEDLRHEVTHAYVHSVVPNVPLWLDEGLAEYFEVPRGFRGLNRAHLEQLLGQSQRGQWQPDLARLERLSRPFEMTQSQYAESWAWVHFLLEAGPEYRALLHEYLEQLRREGSAKPLSEGLNRRLRDPQHALVEHLRRVAVAAGLSSGDWGWSDVGA